MTLSQEIKQYYFDRFDDLPEDKRFHFASRIAAWEGDSEAFKKLGQLRGYMAPAGIELEKIIADLLKSEPHSGINAFKLRRPIFNKYSGLYGIHTVLFRIRHLKSVYGIDAKQFLFKSVSQTTLDQLADKISEDDDALRVLSTYAINFLYLYKSILMGNSDYVDLQKIIKLKDGYNLSDAKHIQLLIYLYTHCIIGETNFYTQEITAQRKKDCGRMLEILEPLIDDNFNVINLDNKLEFLVCARICNFNSLLMDRIYAECQASISDKGHFLVDRHNKNAQDARVTFDKSEHRNVLYIMSQAGYSPHSTLA